MTTKEATDYLYRTLSAYKERCNSEWCNKDREALEVLEKEIERQTPELRYVPDDEDKGHFYTKNGFMICRKTDKDICYPVMSFRDLEYCPRCGQKLTSDMKIKTGFSTGGFELF